MCFHCNNILIGIELCNGGSSETSAILFAFVFLPLRFRSRTLIRMADRFCGPPLLHDGTSLNRKLELRTQKRKCHEQNLSFTAPKLVHPKTVQR